VAGRTRVPRALERGQTVRRRDVVFQVPVSGNTAKEIRLGGAVATAHCSGRGGTRQCALREGALRCQVRAFDAAKGAVSSAAHVFPADNFLASLRLPALLPHAALLFAYTSLQNELVRIRCSSGSWTFLRSLATS